MKASITNRDPAGEVMFILLKSAEDHATICSSMGQFVGGSEVPTGFVGRLGVRRSGNVQTIVLLEWNGVMSYGRLFIEFWVCAKFGGKGFS